MVNLYHSCFVSVHAGSATLPPRKRRKLGYSPSKFLVTIKHTVIETGDFCSVGCQTNQLYRIMLYRTVTQQ